MLNVPTSIMCRLAARNAISRNFTTSVVSKSAETKTPIQKLGWEYLLKQRAKNRPISPHLTIYQPQLTWMLSGFHRISGCVMGGTLLVGGLGFAVLPLDFTTFVDFIRGWNLPCAVTAVFKYIIAFPIIFHTLNGIRFLGFDLAKGVDNIGQVYKSGYLVFAVSAIIALAARAMTRDTMLDSIDMASSSATNMTSFRRRTMATGEMRELLTKNGGCDPIEVMLMKSDNKNAHKNLHISPSSSSHGVSLNPEKTRRMSIGGGMEKNLENEEVNDWEEPRLDIEGFIVDYFQHKIHERGCEWYDAPQLPYGTQPEHEMMRSMAAIFESKHQQDFETFSEQLLASTKMTFSIYQEVVQQVGFAATQSDACPMNYGRLIGLVAFSGMVAAKMMENFELRDQVRNLAVYTSLFIKSRIRASWKEHNKTWAGFMQLGQQMKQKYKIESDEIAANLEVFNRRRRRLSIFGLSAAAVVGIVVGGRFIFGGKV
ncbi:unnamed protein product [Caenorhabditis angaria]|uniref:Apoptosis regulator ced-9 n=1 Tax=Caenorhabditis angaria TaxID=860376 RepID=A0A9P1IH92_9PELO|nr:unnamed protein product [Caenorhabditis angaria]